jgi:hypothetical protein
MKQSTRSRLGKVLAAVGATATVAVVLSAGTAGAATAATPHQPALRGGCPSGNVCVYSGTSESGSSTNYYRYGSYNFSDMFGDHLIVNNQTGGAGFRLCTAYGGQNCGARKGPGRYIENLSPINSILVEP